VEGKTHQAAVAAPLETVDDPAVAGFDRKQGYPNPAEDLAVLAGHGIGPASTVVELGAGTGQFALAAARCVSRVVAVDISPVILAVLRPGGVLRLRNLIFDFPPAEAEEAIDAWLDSAAADPALGYTRDDFAEHLRMEFSTFR